MGLTRAGANMVSVSNPRALLHGTVQHWTAFGVWTHLRARVGDKQGTASLHLDIESRWEEVSFAFSLSMAKAGLNNLIPAGCVLRAQMVESLRV